MISEIVLSQVPRILGFIDRDPESPTYGCADRNYWHYKLSDVPNMRYQEVCLLLALLYKNKFEGNIYYNKDSILELAKGCVDFWLINRNRNGSVSEVYPNERSFCATAFSSVAVLETVIMLEFEFCETHDMVGWLEDAEKTLIWLCNNYKLELPANQQAACSLALYNWYLLNKDEECSKWSAVITANLVLNFQFGKCLEEYGGFDPGYHSLSTALSVRLAEKTGIDVPRMVNKFNKILKVSAKGTIDYAEGTRKSPIVYIYGLSAKSLVKIYKGLKLNKVVSPAWLDDRYVIQLATDYLQTVVRK